VCETGLVVAGHAMGEPCKPMIVMTATERQLARHILQERDERVRAFGDLQARLQDLQRELQKQGQTGATLRPADACPNQEHELRALTAEVRTQQHQQDSHRAVVESAISALRATLQKTDAEVNSGRSALGTLTGRLERLANLVDKRGRVGEERIDGKLAPVDAAGSPGSGVGGSDLQSKGDTTAAQLEGRLEEIEQKQQKLTKDLATLRAAIIEVHINVPVHAVRASRIALRSAELSREERRVALSSLEAKEQQLRADIERIRERNDEGRDQLNGSLSLKDIRNAVDFGP